MANLLFHIIERLALLVEQTAEGMSNVKKVTKLAARLIRFS
jgi:hypothetical protein